MGPFNPEKPPAWAKRALKQVVDAKGRFFHTTEAPEGAKSNAIALGAGTFVAPLPVGWTLNPGAAYTCRLTTREGFDIAYRLDSYDDPDAARGGQRLLSYVDEPEFAGVDRTPADIIKNFVISIPTEEKIGREIVWKSIQPVAGTHVRELVLRCTLLTGQMIDHRASIAQAVAEWMGLGRFSPEFTALDRVAHTEKLERVNFENTVLMRVPRHWKVEEDSVDEGRKLFAVDEPEDRETIWVTSRWHRLPPAATQEEANAFRDQAAEAVWQDMESDTTRRWITKRRETIEAGDILFTLVREEEERGDTLRRVTWSRYGIRDGALVIAPIHLVTAKQFLDDPAQIESAVVADREVRNAILMAPELDDADG